jgi:hypothetical protein
MPQKGATRTRFYSPERVEGAFSEVCLTSISRKFRIAPVLRAVHPQTREESCSPRFARTLNPPWPVRQASLPSAQGVEIGREAGVLVYGCPFQLLLGEARC